MNNDWLDQLSQSVADSLAYDSAQEAATATAKRLNDSTVIVPSLRPPVKRVRTRRAKDQDVTVPNPFNQEKAAADEPLCVEDVAKSQEELYISRLEENGKATELTIAPIPNKAKSLKYALKFELQEPFTNTVVSRIIGSDDAKVPDQPPLSRKYISQFLREPDPRNPLERPCGSLDHPPRIGEVGTMCETLRLSGIKCSAGAFKAREFLLPDELAKLAIASKIRKSGRSPSPDPASYLSPIPRRCFLCYLLYVSNMAIHGTHEEEIPMWYNSFRVFHDQPGEYRLDACIINNEEKGVFGAFPQYMPSRYEFVVEAGTRKILESDDMVFRLTRV